MTSPKQSGLYKIVAVIMAAYGTVRLMHAASSISLLVLSTQSSL